MARSQIILSINPIKALAWSAVLNAIAAVPVAVTLMRIATNEKIIDKFQAGGWLSAVGWFGTAVMATASVVFLGSLVLSNN